MVRIFKNPITDKTEKIDVDTSVCVFFFGPIYLAYKGLWKHALIWLLIAAPLSLVFGTFVLLFSVPFASMVYAATIQSILTQRYQDLCWEEVSKRISTPYEILQAKLYVESITSTFMNPATEPMPTNKACQFCSAVVTLDATICSNCHSDLSAEPVNQLRTAAAA
ncbi:MAG TPA: DUF2628 domain-containing protein [Burkholderiaceae bacterium]|jgi:hypothetical protein